MEKDWAKHWMRLVGLPAAVATLAMLVWAPIYVTFGVVIAEAITWCVWLEQHPMP